MAYQTFKPTILTDTTHSFRNTHFYQGNRQTVKMQKDSLADISKDNFDYKTKYYELKMELEETKTIVDGQNQFIQILRNSIDSKLKEENLEEIINQIQGMAKEQQLDMFALVSQLYQELQQSNLNLNQNESLQLLVDNLNQQLQSYAKELMELKVDKQFLAEQLKRNNSTTTTNQDSEQWKQKYQLLENQFDKLTEEKSIIERKYNKINLNLRTEECEKEELLREMDQLKQVCYKSQVQEQHKLELNLALKQQEIEYLEKKNQKLEQQQNEYNDLNDELQKSIGSLKYQIENLQQQHQIQINQLENDIIKFKQHAQDEDIYINKIENENSVQQNFIHQIIGELQRINENNEEDIYKLLYQIKQNKEEQECIYKQNDQEKSSIIFDLQCQVNDGENNNAKQNEQVRKLEGQLQQMHNEFKQLEKGKRVFRGEYNHLKQLNEQKKEEIEEMQQQYNKLEKKFQQQLEQCINLEKDNNYMKEQQNISLNQIAQLKNQVQNKKNMSFSQSFLDQKTIKQDYQALLQTFEKIKPLFSIDALELVQEMLNVQNKLVQENVDSQTLQEELRIQQKIQLYQINQQQTILQEKTINRTHKQSLSVHFKPKV